MLARRLIVKSIKGGSLRGVDEPACFRFWCNEREWRVVFTDQAFLLKHFNEPEDSERRYVGCCSYLDGCIYLLTGTDRAFLTANLVHELAHCYLFSYTQKTGQYDEEDLCNLTCNMYPFLSETITRFKSFLDEQEKEPT